MIDPRISLEARAPNLQSSFKLFQDTLNNVQNRKMNEQNMAQSAAMNPLRVQQAQDTNAINAQVIQQNNQAAQRLTADQNLQSIVAFSPTLKPFLQSGDNLGALRVLQTRKQQLASQGRDFSDTDEAINEITNGNSDSVLQSLNVAEIEAQQRGLTGIANQTAGQRQFNSMTENFTPEQKLQAQLIDAGIESRAGSITGRERAATDPILGAQVTRQAGDEAAATSGRGATAAGISRRKQGFIDGGVEAAGALNNIKRSLELLDSVKTGGFNSVANTAQRILGVQGADEVELGANLGRAVLSQLKTIFGAAFTQEEGKRLENLEANFGKSTAGNIRLLNQILKTTDRAARRGLSAAKDEGDIFTATEIQRALDSFDGVTLDTEQPTSRFKIITVQ